MLISLVSDGAMAGAAIFRRRALTRLTPVALPDGMASICCRVCRTVMSGMTSFESEFLCFSTKAIKDDGSKLLIFLSISLSARPVKSSNSYRRNVTPVEFFFFGEISESRP